MFILSAPFLLRNLLLVYRVAENKQSSDCRELGEKFMKVSWGLGGANKSDVNCWMWGLVDYKTISMGFGRFFLTFWQVLKLFKNFWGAFKRFWSFLTTFNFLFVVKRIRNFWDFVFNIFGAFETVLNFFVKVRNFLTAQDLNFF